MVRRPLPEPQLRPEMSTARAVQERNVSVREGLERQALYPGGLSEPVQCTWRMQVRSL